MSMLIIDMQMPKHGCCDCMVELMGLCVIQDKDVPLKDENGDYPTELPNGCPIKGELVTCGECKHCFVDGDNVRFNVCELTHNRVQSDDWFCADGERKDGEHE